MKVLFVSSGNSKFGISPVVKNQGNSLIKQGVELDYFTIKGKGIKGYLKNVHKLKRLIQVNQYDLVHAHYALSAFVASLTGAKSLVVSLMGSDVYINYFGKLMIRIVNHFFWPRTIVKSERLKEQIKIFDAIVIPNGVDFEKFRPIEKRIAKTKINFSDKKHILFISNSARAEKNYTLAQSAYHLIDNKNVELNVISNIKNELLTYYYSAADVLILTSKWEGSPNVIKEAMACNLPIVATDVGDVREVIGNTEGCYITSFDPVDVAAKINLTLGFGRRTNGRDHIQHLDSAVIARRIIHLYQQLISA